MPRPVALILASFGALALALVGVAAAGGASETTAEPGGPRLAIRIVHPHRMGFTARLLTIGPEGEAPRTIAEETGGYGVLSSIEHLSWSPDGSEVAWLGPAQETSAVLLAPLDGSSHPRLLATSQHPGGHDDTTASEPLFDPRTGEVLVSVIHTPHGEGLFGDSDRPTGKAGQIRTEFWRLPTDGSPGRRLSSLPLTPRHPLLPYPSSISAGGTMAATALTRRGFALVTIDPRTAKVRTVVPTTTQIEGSLEPAISPDGKRIVYKVDKFAKPEPSRLISTEVLIVPASGGKPRLLARVNGGARWPSWDPSGSRISFTRLNAAGEIDSPGPGVGSALMEINPDGTCLTTAFTVPDAAVLGAAWRPGPGRGIGRLDC